MNFIRICSAFYRVRFNYLFIRIELLNTTAIPDSNFEQALIDLGFDSAPINGSVLTANISGVTNLNVSNKNISDLTGIEDFIALTGLTCYNNQLTSLDVSNNTALEYLECYNNQLISLDVRNGNNSIIEEFDSAANPNLTCIYVDDADYSNANWPNIDPNSTFVNNEAECEALNIGDNALELDVTIYPNPTDNYLFVEGNKNPISISIYNLLGAEVITTSATDKINVSELSKGVYIIRISDGVNQTDKKFIKN